MPYAADQSIVLRGRLSRPPWGPGNRAPCIFLVVCQEQRICRVYRYLIHGYARRSSIRKLIVSNPRPPRFLTVAFTFLCLPATPASGLEIDRDALFVRVIDVGKGHAALISMQGGNIWSTGLGRRPRRGADCHSVRRCPRTTKRCPILESTYPLALPPQLPPARAYLD